MGFNHLGSDGRAILKAALDIGLRKSPSLPNPLSSLSSLYLTVLCHAANYPEYLGKSHMINVPTLFSTMWYFLKQILDEPYDNPSLCCGSRAIHQLTIHAFCHTFRTQAKFEFSGYDYLASLQKDITIENIPTCLGGEFELYNEPFTFDTSSTGPFSYAQAETDRAAFLRRTPRLTFDPATAEVRQAQFYDELHPTSATNGASATAASVPPMTATNGKPTTITLPATATTSTKDTSKTAATATASPATIAVSAKAIATATVTSTLATAIAAVTDSVVGLVQFWVAFVVFTWQQHRWITIGGGVASLALLVYEPPAMLALVLVVLIVVASRSW